MAERVKQEAPHVVRGYVTEVEKIQEMETALASSTASQVKLAISDKQSLPLLQVSL